MIIIIIITIKIVSPCVVYTDVPASLYVTQFQSTSTDECRSPFPCTGGEGSADWAGTVS